MNRKDFWDEVFALHGSVTPFIQGRVFGFVLFAALVHAGVVFFDVQTGLAIAPYEIIGVVLALLLVLRTNSGYDRWYEGRKLWGGIVNQSRNLGVIGLAHGPDDPQWREQLIRWTAAFAFASKQTLREERNPKDFIPLLGKHDAEWLVQSQHMPLAIATKLDELFREAIRSGGMDRFAYLQVQNERAQLIDHIGACERILKTPLARVFSIKIRRFIFLYLISLPLAIVDKTHIMTPIIMLLVAYPLLSLDQIGIELQNPFCPRRLSHLPLEDICQCIRGNLFGLLPELDEPVSTDETSAGQERAQLAAI